MKRIPFGAMALLAGLSLGLRASAATLTWDVTAGDGATVSDGDGAWSNGAGNWNTGAGDANWNNATPDSAILGAGSGGAAGTLTLGSAVTVGNLTFSAPNGSYTVNGGGNTLTMTGTTLDVGTGLTATINAAVNANVDVLKGGDGKVILTADNSAAKFIRTVNAGVLQIQHNGAMGGNSMHTDVASGATLEVTGGLSGIVKTVFLQGSGVGGAGALHSLSGANTFSGAVNLGSSPNATINVDAGGTLTFSQTIVTWPTANRGITKIGDGTLVLNGASAYDAGTTLNAGTIRLGNAAGLGVGGATVNAGTLNLNAQNATLTYLAGSGGTVTDNGAAGTTTFTISSGATTNTSAAVVAGGTRTISFVKQGTGKQTLTGIGNNVGAVEVKGAGILELAGSSTTTMASIQVGQGTFGTLAIAGSATLTVPGQFLLGNPRYIAGQVTQSGGTVNLNGVTDSNRIGHWPDETSTYTLSGGVLNIANASNLRIGWDGTGAVNVSGGTLNAGSATIMIGRSAGGTLSVSAGVVNASAISISPGGGSGCSMSVSGTGAVNVGSLTVGDAASKAGTVTQSGGTVTVTGAMRIAHYLTESSSYTLSSGNLSSSVTVYIGWDGTGALNISGGTATLYGLRLGDGNGNGSGPGTLNLTGGRLELGAGGLTYRATYDAENLGGGTLAATATWSTGAYLQFTGTGGSTTLDTLANTLTLSGNCFGAGGFGKIGSGTLVLSGNNTYAGATTVSVGTLKAGSATALPSGAGKGDVTVNGKLDTAGFAININGLSGSGTVDNSVGNGTVTMGNGNAGGTFSGTLTDAVGALSIAKTGNGTQNLTGVSTLSGNTTVSGGVLSLSTGWLYSNLAWQNKTVTVSGGGVLEIGGWADGDGRGIGQLAFAAGNILVNGGTLRYTGSTTSGTSDRGFTVGAGGAILDASGAIAWQLNQGRAFGIVTAAGGTVTLTGPANGTLDMTLGGGGGLVKSGAGTWTLTGTKTYTGATTVSQGELRMNAAHTGGALYTVSGGVLSGTGTINSSVTVGAAGSLAPGDGGVGTLNIASGGTLTLEENSTCAWEANGTLGDLVNITGNIVLPGALNLTVSGALPSSGPAVVFRWTGSNTGATDLRNWLVSNSLRAKIVGNEVRLEPSTGTVFMIR